MKKDKNKQLQKAGKNETSIVRSSAEMEKPAKNILLSVQQGHRIRESE